MSNGNQLGHEIGRGHTEHGNGKGLGHEKNHDHVETPPPGPTISISDASAVEQFTQFGYSDNPYNGGTTENEFGGFFPMEFTITLSAPSTETVTVHYATPDTFDSDPTTATPGEDFIPTNDTLTFLPGEVSKTITVYGADDFSPEDLETFTVTLSDATNATIADDTGVGTIIDNDVNPFAVV